MRLDDEKKLIGRVIIGYILHGDNTELVLRTTDGEFKFYTDADCCSESWIEHVATPKLPARILSIEEKDLGEAPGTRQEYDQKYSTIFKTSQGDFEVEYRNSSNGYYGGSLELIDYPDELDEIPKE